MPATLTIHSNFSHNDPFMDVVVQGQHQLDLWLKSIEDPSDAEIFVKRYRPDCCGFQVCVAPSPKTAGALFYVPLDPHSKPSVTASQIGWALEKLKIQYQLGALLTQAVADWPAFLWGINTDGPAAVWCDTRSVSVGVPGCPEAPGLPVHQWSLGVFAPAWLYKGPASGPQLSTERIFFENDPVATVAASLIPGLQAEHLAQVQC